MFTANASFTKANAHTTDANFTHASFSNTTTTSVNAT